MNRFHFERVKSLVVFLFAWQTIHTGLQAQGSIEYVNTPEVWQKLHPMGKISMPDAVPSILLISNRERIDTGIRFMGFNRHPAGQLHYYVVKEWQNTWYYERVGSLAEGLQKMGLSHHWVIYNEGMGKVFTTNIFRGLAMTKQYGVHVLMLDYPSISPSTKPIKSYRFAVKNARQMYQDFAVAVDSFRIYTQGQTKSTSLFMHSMGNYFMRALAKKHYLPSLTDQPWLDNLIFNAPCVPTMGHRKWMQKIKAAKNIFVNYNPADATLYWAHIAMFKKQLGEKVRRPICSHVNYINFQPLVGKSHSNFVNLPSHMEVTEAAKRYYGALLAGGVPNVRDTSLFTESPYKNLGKALRPLP